MFISNIYFKIRIKSNMKIISILEKIISLESIFLSNEKYGKC